MLENIKLYSPFAFALVLAIAGIGITATLFGETLLALAIMAGISFTIFGALKLYVRWYANQ